jgi:hypothetical protein
VIVEELSLIGRGSQTAGVDLEGLSLESSDEPAVVRNCIFTGYTTAIQITGKVFSTNKPQPCRNVLAHSCKIGNCARAFGVVGDVKNVALLGNTIWNCGVAGFDFDFLPGSERILIANNSVMVLRHALLINDAPAEMRDVFVHSNLIVSERGTDMAFTGNDSKKLASWVFSHNWREVPNQAKRGPDWILSDKDVMVENLPLLPRDPSHVDFLRPPPDSPLATRGVGGDLPTYVGAVPPAGVEPWDWEKTWKARAK